MLRFDRVARCLVLAAAAIVSLGVAAPALAGSPLAATLTGAAEVTAGGIPNQGDLDGSGTAVLRLNRGKGEICYVLTVSGITLPASAAHIHVAPATTTGPVVVPLAPPDASGSSSGCVAVDRALIKAISQHPEHYYVNVHTSDYPAGALRGQLSK